MRFIPLQPNHSRRPLNHHFLQENMEEKQFKHSSALRQHLYSTKYANNLGPRSAKKQRYRISSSAIPFYQRSTHRRTLNTYHIRAFQLNQQSTSIKISSPVPRLVNPAKSKNLLQMTKNIQSGSVLEVKGEVEKLIFCAKWENILYHVENKFCVYLMSEFYCNMRPIRGLDGILHLTSVVGGKPVLVDHKTLNLALHLPHKLTAPPCINIYATFPFEMHEFELMVGFFTDSDVPYGLCASNVGIHYKHFTPIYQLVALIFRANIIPKPNQDQFFDFYDIKLMFLFVNNQIDFSISYVILLNMINAHIAGYVPYGNLLTSVFKVYHLPMPEDTKTLCNSYISVSHVRTQISLDKCEPEPVSLFKLPNFLEEEVIYLADNMSVLKLFDEQKVEMQKLKNRIAYLEGICAAPVRNSRDMDVDIGSLYQVQLVDEGNLIADIDMFNEIEAVGAGTSGKGVENEVVEVTGIESGFVVAGNEALE